MAGLYFKVVKSAIALTASQAHTLMQIIAGTNSRVKVLGVKVSFDGITAADPPIVFDIVRQTTGGTMNATTIVKENLLDTETLQTTARDTASSTEPTTTDLLDSFTIHQQSSDYYTQPDGKPWVITGGTRLGFRTTPGTLTGTVHAYITIFCEE